MSAKDAQAKFAAAFASKKKKGDKGGLKSSKGGSALALSRCLFLALSISLSSLSSLFFLIACTLDRGDGSDGSSDDDGPVEDNR
jgi:hypothetical protein